jgi:hypothetical protein
MIKTRDKVMVVNNSSDLYGRQGRVLMVNREFNNAYVIMDKVRYLINLKDLDIMGGYENE